jgi:hypothetical protein
MASNNTFAFMLRALQLIYISFKYVTMNLTLKRPYVTE